MIRVVIADDQEVVRVGLAAMLGSEKIKIVGQACDGNEAVKKVLEHDPDVVLLDLNMPKCGGLEALSKLKDKAAQARILIFAGKYDKRYAAKAAELGAVGYLPKSMSAKELAGAIRRAAEGHLETNVAKFKKRRGNRFEINEDMPLTKREVEVLKHAATGSSNSEIGKTLDISVETVKEHMQNILKKLGVSDRTEAAIWAVRKGLA